MSKTINTDEDSYDIYKKYLEDSIGVHNLNPPNKPMNGYMRFFFERSCEERSKGNKDWKIITQQISEQWKKLAPTKKQYYDKLAKIRSEERNQIHDEYLRLIKKKKPATAWARFFKKRYSLYTKEKPKFSAKDITKLVTIDWKAITDKQKAKYTKEYEEDRVLYQNRTDNTQRIEEYKERVQKFNQQLNEEKQKIMKKFGVSKQALEKQKLLKKIQERQKKSLENQQKRRLANDKKRKQRQEKAKAEKAEKQTLKKQKQEVKQSERKNLSEDKKRSKSADVKPKKKLATPAQQPEVKVQESKPITPAKPTKAAVTPKIKNEVKKQVKSSKAATPKKTKQIKKAAPVKKAVVKKESVKKVAVNKEVAKPIKVSAKKAAKQSKDAKKAVAKKGKK